MFFVQRPRYSVTVPNNWTKNLMKKTLSLAALSLSLAAPSFAGEADNSQANTASSDVTIQERGSSVGRGTRNTASTTRSKTQLL